MTSFYSFCGQFFSGVCLPLYTAETQANSCPDGASLIYTTPSTPSQLPSLIHSSLGIHSLLKKHPLKHNVIDRDKIVVPPNWDSWGKIRVLREGFDVELASNGWTIDLDQPPRPSQPDSTGNASENGETNDGSEDPEGSTVTLYESAVADPTMDALQLAGRTNHSTKLEVETTETQVFLAQQLKALEAYRLKTEEAREDSRAAMKRAEEEGYIGAYNSRAPEAKVLEHIGPVQFNMGGIQVDADDMVQRLKVRSTFHSKPEETITDVNPLGPTNIWLIAGAYESRRCRC